MSSSASASSADASGSGSAHDRVLLPGWFSPTLYDVTLHPTVVDPSERYRFEGAVTITADVREAGKTSVTLHAKELAFHDAEWIPAAPGAGPIPAKRIETDAGATTVEFKFDAPLPQGTGKLAIRYAGTHNNQMAGFYRSSYTDVHGNKKIMVSTQFEALDARRCLPCVDEPAAKAVFKATLVVDDHLTALSNMPEAETTLLPGKKKRVTFLPSVKMSTYLLAFAVGEMDFVSAVTKNGKIVRVFTPPGKASTGAFSLDVACRTLDLFEDYFAVPYPLPKMDLIAITEFAMGAMENWGLITFREVELLLHPQASADQKQRVTTVVTHEIAHQWFGNLVTMSWWDGLWLNEGFASWMQYFATDKLFPEWSMWAQFITDDQASAFSLDSLASSHPVHVPIRHAEEVEEVFDAISYCKGMTVVQLAYAFLGPDGFRDGLRLYMRRHAWGNTETTDLWKAWEDATGKPVTAVMSNWVSQMGFPYVRVGKIRADKDALSFSAQQRWFLADGSKPDGFDAKTWKIPMFVAYGTGAGGADDVTVNGASVGMLDGLDRREFSLQAQGVSSQSWLKLNSAQNVLYRVLYEDAEDVEKLAKAVQRRDMANPADRAGLVLDAYALAKAGLTDPAQLVTLLSAYAGEDDMAVWDAIEQCLNGLHSLVRGSELEPALVAFARRLIEKRAAALGWEAKPEDTHLDSLSRGTLVRLQAKFMADDERVQKRAREWFDAYLLDPVNVAIPADLRAPVLRVAVSRGSTQDMEALKASLKKLDAVAQMKDVYLSIGFTPKPEDKIKVLDWCTSGAIKLQDFFYPMSSTSGSSAEGAEITYKYMKDNYVRIADMIKSASPSLLMAVISYSCSGFASHERASEIEAFFADPKHHSASTERRVAQIVENTRANAAFLDRIRASAKFKTALGSSAAL